MDSGVIATLQRFDHLFEKALYYISGFLLLTIASSVFYSVTMRYVFNEPPLWADEAPRAFFLWMTYLGVAVATKRGQNIRVTHFIDKFSPKPQVILETFMHTLVLIMLCTLVWYNFPILELQMGGSMLSTGWSFVWLYAPVSVGSVLMLFYQSRLMILTLLNYQAQLERGT
jgi:TRAP-type C4-dicarboxylate transport system permease small subunit